MKWVLGTGRCGMKNYTEWKKGFIHSDQRLREIAVKRYQEKDLTQGDINYAYEVLKTRRDMEVPSVADCCQFMFIDMISYIDPAAEFVWVKRDRENCIRSFMDRGAEDERIHPVGWDFNYQNKRRLLEWYYDEVNRIIEVGLQGKKFEQIRTEDMPLLVAS